MSRRSVADLRRHELLGAIVDEIATALGRIDILVNCAGIAESSPSFLDCTIEGWDEIHDVNIKAPFVLMQCVARHMIRQGAVGQIVNVSSSSAFRARFVPLAYGSSKAALVQLARGATVTPLLVEKMGGGYNVRQAAHDGPIANRLGRAATPDDVAQTILFLCRPASRQITAQTIHASGGVVA